MSWRLPSWHLSFVVSVVGVGLLLGGCGRGAELDGVALMGPPTTEVGPGQGADWANLEAAADAEKAANAEVAANGEGAKEDHASIHGGFVTRVFWAGEGEDATIGPPVAERPYALDTGDRIRIFVYGQPNLSRTYRVDAAGFVALPLIGPVRARGATVYALKRHIARKLAREFVRDPEVSVEVVERRPFFILGEVRNAGQYPFVPGMSVRTAVAIAGGYSPRANERKVKITRIEEGRRVTRTLPADAEVRPGDTIYVPERWF